jgi:hypothetical protein
MIKQSHVDTRDYLAHENIPHYAYNWCIKIDLDINNER